jgi:hypothetical protein
MPTWPDKGTNKQDFTKRRSFEEGRALIDAAHRATHRLYCEALGLWRRCPSRRCRRQQRCLGEPTACLKRGLADAPRAPLAAARRQVIAGGPRRVEPATHIEWVIRRVPIEQVLAWRF